MALDERYIPLNSLNSYYVNKDDALALANGTLEFYRDTSRNTPKTVYQLTTSGGEYVYTALPNPVTLNAAGTAQNAGGDNVIMYAYPYITNAATGALTEDLYYIVAKDSGGNVQWTREAIPTGQFGGGGSVDDGLGASNELANPQFSRYFLTDATRTLTVSTSNQVFPIAPDWDLVASGTGTITVQRVPVSGSNAIPTYPAYYLSITVGAGVTSPYLRQRLNYNSGIWSGTYLSGFFVGKVGVGSNALSMKYQDAAGVTTNVTIFDASLTSSWAAYGGSVLIADSSNTLSGASTYVDIVIDLPLGNTTDITSLQVLSSDDALIGDIQAYDKRSANRDQAIMGDWYIPRLEKKPIPSLLVGWDFPKNPTQFNSSGTVGVNTAEYIWDQTILQTSTLASVDFSRSTASGGLNLVHTVADQSYALIQYLEKADASKFIGSRLSVNINGYTTDGVSSAGTTAVQVNIFANAASNQFGTLPTSLVTVSTAGVVSLTAAAVANNWYEITRSNLPTAKGNLTALTASGNISEVVDLALSQWVVEDDAQVTAGIQGIAVVVSFVPAASSTNYNTVVDSISVTLGDIPTRPAPLSYENTLLACQRYYETTFRGDQPIPSVTTTHIKTAPMTVYWSGANSTVYSNNFGEYWKATKRTDPTLTFYSGQSTTANRVESYLEASGGGTHTENVLSTYWGTVVNGQKGFFVYAIDSAALIGPTAAIRPGAGFILYHYIADARIGVVA